MGYDGVYGHIPLSPAYFSKEPLCPKCQRKFMAEDSKARYCACGYVEEKK